MLRAADRGIPTVTLVTDVGRSGRVAYVGLDNAAAGATAAFLLARLTAGRPGVVLAGLSHRAFLGEQERWVAFRDRLAVEDPGREVEEVGRRPRRRRGHRGSWSRERSRVGSGCAASTRWAGATRASPRRSRLPVSGPLPFVGHDLDADNLALLRTGVLTAVLHHDLRADLRAALTQLLRAHRLLPGAPTSVPSAPQVVTPWNVPPRLRP